MTNPDRFVGTDEAVHRLLERNRAILIESRLVDERKKRDSPIPRHNVGEKFVCGPVPFSWLQVALAVGGKSGSLAWAIWWLVGIKKANPVRLTAKVLSDFSISTRTTRRLLGDFEQAGLVQVERCRGRGPTVTVLPAPTAKSNLLDNLPKDE